mgnify:CR=1 FL=1
MFNGFIHRLSKLRKNAADYRQVIMLDPSSMAEGSIMPHYPFLFEDDLDISSTRSKIHAMRQMGVPYPHNYEDIANDDLKKQATEIVKSLKSADIEIEPSKEIISLIAYLQRLGIDIKAQDQN